MFQYPVVGVAGGDTGVVELRFIARLWLIIREIFFMKLCGWLIIMEAVTGDALPASRAGHPDEPRPIHQVVHVHSGHEGSAAVALQGTY